MRVPQSQPMLLKVNSLTVGLLFVCLSGRVTFRGNRDLLFFGVGGGLGGGLLDLLTCGFQWLLLLLASLI